MTRLKEPMSCRWVCEQPPLVEGTEEMNVGKTVEMGEPKAYKCQEKCKNVQCTKQINNDKIHFHVRETKKLF